MDHLLECTTCGQRYQSSGCEPGMRSYCEKCGQLLEASNRGEVWKTLFLSIACLVLLVPANIYPILRFSFQGQWSEGEIVTGSILLYLQHSPIVAAAVFFTSVIAPFALHFMVTSACILLLGGWFPRMARKLWRLLFEFQEWGMIDVYLLALGVGAIKLLSMGSVEPRTGLWMMILFVLTSGLCLGGLSPCAIWGEFRRRSDERREARLEHNAISCHHCGNVQLPADEDPECEICESPLHEHDIDDRRVWAYLWGAVALYIPANLLPVMTMTLLGHTGDYTVMGGILYLWDEQSYVPACIVFLGSIIVPCIKIGSLFYLLIAYKRHRHQREQTRLFLIVKTMGRWSMVDIFVLAVLVALGQMGTVATIEPRLGAVAFCGVVILTMFSANNFQARWIWSEPDALPTPPSSTPYAPGTQATN